MGNKNHGLVKLSHIKTESSDSELGKKAKTTETNEFFSVHVAFLRKRTKKVGLKKKLYSVRLRKIRRLLADLSLTKIEPLVRKIVSQAVP